MTSLQRYWHTVRFLRPVQIHGRIRFRLARPKPDLRPPPPLRRPSGAWIRPPGRQPSLVGPERFRLLNEEHSLADHGWDDPALTKLWRYNLHYFDDVNAAGAAERAGWHETLIGRWIKENPPGRGTGWEPYPTSLRIVNWIKWVLDGHGLPEPALASLAVQARWLERRIEWHLLGNHLLANAKALVFAGLFFDGEEAEWWLSTGLAILQREMPEQILSDGGHFERSPMYHALVLEDLLDLANLANWFQNLDLRDQVADRIDPMRRWLAALTHPDGEIAFFNDAAFKVALRPAALDDYAQRLGFAPLPEETGELGHSGYLRIDTERMALLIDTAPLGPDYLPGHAHADTLSFELSVDGRRVLVNSGTSEYGNGPERLRQRGTAAHNTVVVDGRDSSEVWAGFRVARRARPSRPVVTRDGAISISSSHDGYARLAGRPIHRRAWRVESDGLVVSDTITGPERRAVARFHFHPDLEPQPDGCGGAVLLDGCALIRWSIEQGEGALEPSSWHPEFGLAIPSTCLAVACVENRAVIRFTLEPAILKQPS